jgi:predicted membrane channel-forming protein YqfA (hemolysin III family)
VQVDFLNDRHAWPLLAGLTSGMALYLCSAAAHCLQSRSELAHYVAFTFDYAGIGLYGLGSVIMHLEYCSEDAFYDTVQPLFVPAGCILAVMICFCCSVSKTRYERPYPFTRKVCLFSSDLLEVTVTNCALRVLCTVDEI